jgi:Trk-type K+ transport system membrane component
MLLPFIHGNSILYYGSAYVLVLGIFLILGITGSTYPNYETAFHWNQKKIQETNFDEIIKMMAGYKLGNGFRNVR